MLTLKFQDGGQTSNPLSHLDKSPIQQITQQPVGDGMTDEEWKEFWDNYKYNPKYEEYAREYNARQNLDDKLTLGDLGVDGVQVLKTAMGSTKKIPYLGAVLTGVNFGNDLKQAYLKYKMGESFSPDVIEGLLGLLPFKTSINEAKFFKSNPNKFFNFLERLSSVTGNWLTPVVQQTTHWSNDDVETTKFLFGGNLPLIAKSGIKIKKKNRGKFTESAKEHGMGVQEYARKVLNDPNATPLQKKRANFAVNSKKWKHV